MQITTANTPNILKQQSSRTKETSSRALNMQIVILTSGFYVPGIESHSVSLSKYIVNALHADTLYPTVLTNMVMFAAYSPQNVRHIKLLITSRHSGNAISMPLTQLRRFLRPDRTSADKGQHPDKSDNAPHGPTSAAATGRVSRRHWRVVETAAP